MTGNQFYRTRSKENTGAFYTISDINDCSSTACDNGGTCIDAVDDFSCCCAIGYAGDTCQTSK